MESVRSWSGGSPPTRTLRQEPLPWLWFRLLRNGHSSNVQFKARMYWKVIDCPLASRALREWLSLSERNAEHVAAARFTQLHVRASSVDWKSVPVSAGTDSRPACIGWVRGKMTPNRAFRMWQGASWIGLVLPSFCCCCVFQPSWAKGWPGLSQATVFGSILALVTFLGVFSLGGLLSLTITNRKSLKTIRWSHFYSLLCPILMAGFALSALAFWYVYVAP